MSLAHGLLLHDQGKPEQAEKAYREHLANEPNDDYAHSRLALCLLEQVGKKRDALEEIDRAIALEANQDYYHSVRSIILANLNRGKEALEAADRAIAIEPEATFNFTARASALAELMRWSEAEAALRQALTLDSDNGFAKNLLANVLQNQGKSVESEIATDQLLAENPESPFAHANAGWDALRRRNHKKAEEHFREALRLDSDFDFAREGLLESFKSRSWFYRTYLRYTFFMAKFTEGKQWIIILGLYFAYQIGRRLLKEVNPIASGALVVVWLGLVLWIWLAPGIGSFLVLMDRSARHALKKSEKWLGITVGGGLFISLPAFLTGLGIDHWLTFMIGCTLLLSTIPASLTFSNPSRKGRFVFGSIYGFVFFAGVLSIAFKFNPLEDGGNPFIGILWLTSVILPLLCTWIGNISALREDDSG